MKKQLNTSLIPVTERILPESEIKNLIRIAQQDNSAQSQEAKEAILKSNTRLILNCIKRFHTSEDIDDLFQVGCIGLMKAINTFDFTYNVKFNTYAVPAIINEIRKYLRTSSLVHISQNIREDGIRIHAVTEKLRKQLNREPTIEEIAQQTEMSVDRVNQTLYTLNVTNPISLDEPLNYNQNDCETDLNSLIESPYTDNDMITELNFKQTIMTLTEKERHIINLIVYEGLKQAEVASILHISQAHVSRIYKATVQKIKKELQ